MAGRIEREIAALMPDLRRYARSLARGTDDADDLLQDGLEQALRNVHLFRPGTNLRAWMFTLLRNRFISGCRRSRRERAVIEAHATASDGMVGPVQEDRVAIAEIGIAFLGLRHADRQILLLIAAEGLRYTEAADLLGVELGTVKSRMSRARRRLDRAQRRRPAAGHVVSGQAARCG